MISLNEFNSIIEISLMIHSYFVHGFEWPIYVNVDWAIHWTTILARVYPKVAFLCTICDGFVNYYYWEL